MYLHSVPIYRYDTSRTATPEIGDYSTARFEKNNYSVPVRYLRRTVTVKGYADKVLIMYNGKLIATHDRLFGSGKTSYRLEHYIDLLERKSRGVFQAKPVRDTVAEELIDWAKSFPVVMPKWLSFSDCVWIMVKKKSLLSNTAFHQE
ncbi:Mu transposase domain-containing protein [Coprococcus sp. OM06-25]|uniref:Mu transposase domain-containing protein n=1 Tax=Coprococcus sp. OM06-25 TaxID=2293094 RepID=UPI003FA4C52D